MKIVAKSILFSAVVVCLAGCVSSGEQASSEPLDPNAETLPAVDGAEAGEVDPEGEDAESDSVESDAAETSEVLPEFGEPEDYRLEDESAAADFSEQAVMQTEASDAEASFSLNEIKDSATSGEQVSVPATETETGDNSPEVSNSLSESSYVVVAGDTLSHIAQRLLGSAYKWKELASLNQIANPNRIYPGQTLQIQGAPQVSQR